MGCGGVIGNDASYGIDDYDDDDDIMKMAMQVWLIYAMYCGQKPCLSLHQTDWPVRIDLQFEHKCKMREALEVLEMTHWLRRKKFKHSNQNDPSVHKR